jgi:hypothetical protein
MISPSVCCAALFMFSSTTAGSVTCVLSVAADCWASDRPLTAAVSRSVTAAA